MKTKNQKTNYAGDRPSPFILRLAQQDAERRGTTLALNRRFSLARRLRRIIAICFGL